MEHRIKTGLLFGSFNPVHIGHLVIAHHILAHEHLDEIWFVVSPHNPLKNNSDLLPEQDRLAMVRMAIEDEPAFVACSREFSLPKPSFTYATLEILKKENPNYEFTLIIGGDNLAVFDQWRDYEKILATIPIIVYPRPEYTTHNFPWKGSIRNTQAPLIGISSTMIRAAIRAGHNPKYLLPEKVYRMITERNWYRD